MALFFCLLVGRLVEAASRNHLVSRRVQIKHSLESTEIAAAYNLVSSPLASGQRSRYSIYGISLEIFHRWNTFGASISWSVEYTDEFGEWYATLVEAIQDDIVRVVGLLEAKGPQLSVHELRTVPRTAP